MTFIPIKEALDDKIQNNIVKTVFLFLRTREVMGKLLALFLPPLARDIEIHSLREKKLFLLTPSPVASQETYLQSEEIKQELNKRLGDEIVKEVKLRIKGAENRQTHTS